MAPATLAQVSEMIGLIYQAAYDEEQWDPAIHGIRQLFSRGTSRLSNHAIRKVANCAFTANPGYGYFQKYVEKYAQANLYLGSRPADALQKARSFVNAFEMDQYDDNDPSTGWTESHATYDEPPAKQLNGGHAFSTLRHRPKPNCDTSEVETFALLAPHFERASQISQQIKLANALKATFSRLPFGAVLVTADLRILEVNDIAAAWLDDNQTQLMQRNGFLTAKPAIHRPLQKLAADACGLHINGLMGTGGRMVLEKTSEIGAVADCVLEVAPIFDSPFPGMTIGRCAIVIIKKIHMGNPEGLDEHIGAIFKLTRSEARLAGLLAAGYSLKDAANEANLKNTTARAYLERLFHKTGTHQQSQLVALLKNAAPALLKT
ncbi:hypothetical protein HB779_00545 (plasmid) [Phyllobacterium sp. 628]|uniref:helix-turn-helix transcriptional regulator n=1 Tax=Phyllobacterium sp. 628 TaxID=2718938 RepID=UPI0016627F2A|nr:LuxR C-terminal-related transcriptional regulator [Phyllobacterium sp. 628]QND50509.1 hypothetical protein HB779_00545 [Phyllobacterium sp. 628]